MNQTYLQFDFADPRIQTKWQGPLCFANPLGIITTHDLKEVKPALQAIQNAVDTGLYAAGYVSYEAAPAFNPYLQVPQKGELPLLWFGIYQAPLPADFKQSKGAGLYEVDKWQPQIGQRQYEANITKIKQAIQAGETYQVNYTMRLQTQFRGDELAYYRQLAKAQQANFAAYLDTGDHRILSLSPELFFYWDGETITARPMKGTKERGRHAGEDEIHRQWLRESEKDRAENSMIVDLLRNDLSQIAEFSSVKVGSKFDIETYPTVFQMSSTVTAQTKPSTTIEDIFRAIFPCGSITGAPKASTMQHIARLEQAAREVYCGAIGVLTPQREAMFNVPIRTVWINAQTGVAKIGAGGGVTWDSTAVGEYEEAITKTRFLQETTNTFSLFESLLLQDGEWYLLDRHLDRLCASAAYFQYACDRQQIATQLAAYALLHPEGELKVRLVLGPQGELVIEQVLLTPLAQPFFARLATCPIDRNDRFFYHKTTNRTIFDQHKQAHPDVADVLLYNEQGELTEFTIGNLVVEIQGQKWTPPVDCGLLPGTFRAELIATGKVQERVLTRVDLMESQQIWMVNSVRGFVPVSWVD